MQKTFVTIAGPDNNPSVAERAAAIVKSCGVPDLQIAWLKRDFCCDLTISVASTQLTILLRRRFADFGHFDIFVQTDVIPRQKKLFLADMDATMIEGESLDDIAAEAGIKDKIVPITERAMRGEIDFSEALRQRLALLKGLPVTTLQKVLANIRLSQGAAETLRVFKRHGMRSVLVSGGFDIFTASVAQSLGFDDHFSNRLVIEQGRLTGQVMEPIMDAQGKRQKLLDECRRLNISPALSMAVGDGANDIPMLETAGIGVGYHAKPKVVEKTPHQIRFSDMRALACVQGYVI